MPKYSAQATRAASTTASSGTDTVFTLTATAAVRPRIYELIFGSAAAPADQACLMHLQRTTTPGAGTALAGLPLDPADQGDIAVFSHTKTGAPTYTASSIALSFALNQQATFRWIVPPDEGIVLPATASNGAGLRFSVTTGAAVHAAQLFWQE